MVEAPEDNPYILDPDLKFRDVDELSRSEAEDQADRLREAIDYYDHCYYIENAPVLADKTYDTLFE